MTTIQFNVNDRVTVVSCEDAPEYIGSEGVILVIREDVETGYPHPFYVQFSDGETDYFSAEELSLNGLALEDIERRALSFALGKAAALSRDKEFWAALTAKVVG